jgi:hypothetical protein
MHHQTAKALKDRSQKAIQRLGFWVDHLNREMRTQQRAANSSVVPDRHSKYVDDPHPEIITLRWAEVEQLIAALRSTAAELQKFTK